MSMLPCNITIKCGEGKTKQKVGMEHDINKIVAKFKKTGQMPSLNWDGNNLSDGENIIDLTSVGDFQECQNRIAKANEMFSSYPSLVRRRFNNNVDEFVSFMDNIKNPDNLKEALLLGLVEEKITEPAKTTVNKDVKTEE